MPALSPKETVTGFAVRDGNLITGQQHVSGEETARLQLETLGR